MKLYLYGFVALLVAGLTWALHAQVKHNGVLTVQVDNALAQAKQNADDRDKWRQHAEDLSALQVAFSGIALKLDKRIAAQDKFTANAQRSFRDVLKTDTQAADVMRTRASPSVIRLLCDAGRYDESAAAELCGGSVTPDAVPSLR